VVKIQVNHALDRSVTVRAGDIDLYTYVYAPDTPQLESPKPYLHPVRTLAGEVITAFRPHDHVWHKGIAWSLPNVGEHNFWGGPTYLRDRDYVQLDNNGSAVHREMTSLTTTGLAHRLDWFSQHGAKVIDERRQLTTTVLDADTWMLVFESAMTNVSGDTLAFGSPTTKGRPNAGYGGLFWRGPRSFTGGVLQSPTGVGGDDLRGTKAEWFGFRGQHDDTGGASTIVMVDDPANPRSSPQWFARTEAFACLNPAPFFSSELELSHGTEITFRYAVVVAAGDHGEDGTVALAARGREALG
jgi:hypothetical protein